MGQTDLEYLEDVITYNAIRGKDKEIICPSILDYIDEHTFLKESNNMLLSIVKDFFIEHARVPELSEMKIFIVGDESMKMFADFIRLCKSFDKNLDIERVILVKHMEDFFRQRIMMGAIKDAHIKEVAGIDVDIAEIYKRIDDAMGIYLMDDIGLNLFNDHEEYIKELVSEETRISTGFKWLDEQLGGGLLATGSVLYNFCAASNVGKSNFIKSLAGNIAKQGLNVLVVSLEMPRFIYANRFVAELSDFPIQRLKENQIGVTDFLKGAKAKGYGDILIKDFATGSITPQGLMSYIKRAQKTLGIKFDVIFVDYPELLKPSKTYSGRHDLTIAQQYIETRAISFSLKTPIVSVAQLNREAYGKEKPSMDSIGGAIGIMQCSDFAAFLYATDDMKAINILGLSIGKSRFGPVNRSHNYIVDEKTLKITESTNEYDATPDKIEPKDTSYMDDENDDSAFDLEDMFAGGD